MALAPRHLGDRSYASVFREKAALQMRVTEERERQLEMRKAAGSFASIGHVFILILGSTVTEMKMFEPQRPFCQLAQIAKLFAIQVARGPTGSRLCYFVEPINIIDAGDNFIVIAANDGGAMGSGPFDDLAGMRIVSDEVAAADDLVEFVNAIGEDGLQGVPVCVDIAEKEESQHTF